MYNILFCFVPPQALYALFLKLFHKKIFRKQSSAFSFWKRAWGLLAVTNLDELTKLPKVCQLGVFVLDWIDPDFVSSFRYLQVDDHRCKAWIKNSHTGVRCASLMWTQIFIVVDSSSLKANTEHLFNFFELNLSKIFLTYQTLEVEKVSTLYQHLLCIENRRHCNNAGNKKSERLDWLCQLKSQDERWKTTALRWENTFNLWQFCD